MGWVAIATAVVAGSFVAHAWWRDRRRQAAVEQRIRHRYQGRIR